MPKSKSYFVEFKDQIKDEHVRYEAHLEEKELPKDKCDHKGKVKAVPGGIRCSCGTGWSGGNVYMLIDHFNESVI